MLYANYVDLFGENLNTVRKKNTEALLESSKKVDLEKNTERIALVLVSRDKIIRKIINTFTRASENLTKF